MNASSILIDLTQSTDVVLIERPEDRIQRDARDRAVFLLKRFTEEAVQYEQRARNSTRNSESSDWIIDRVHNAILVNGSRGSGKTTLIRNIFSDIERGIEVHFHKIMVLYVMDPTLLEGKENIVVNIVSRIVKSCEEVYNFRGSSGDSEEKYTAFRKSLSKLSSGFSLLDGVGSERIYDASWDDPQHILSYGLSRARSGAEFETCLHNFIRHALDFLDKSAFILAFDDIDTKFDKGWPVLESIRKYLTTPQLILMISGDFGLYSQLVRREQYLNLGENLLRNDRPNRDYHNEEDLSTWSIDPMVNLVDRLEEQYLQKILKPENRITLSTLAEMEESSSRKYSILIKSSGFGATKLLSDFVDDILKKVLFITDSGDATLYRRALLSQPLRTVIQFLKTGDKIINETDHSSNQEIDAFRRDLPNIFASALYHQRLDPTAMASSDPDSLIAQIIEWSEATNGWETSYRLRPEYRAPDRNMAAFVLAVQVAKIVQHSSAQALVYMIKLGLTREFMIQRGNINSREIVRALGLDMRERPSTVARRAVAVQRALSGRLNGLDRGTVPVSGAKIDTPNMLKHLYFGDAIKGKAGERAAALRDNLASINQAANRFPRRPILAWWRGAANMWDGRGPWRGIIYNTLDSLKQKFGRARVAYLSACVITDNRSQDRSHISIFPLIACIAELLEIANLPAASRAAELRRAFARLSQLRSYPISQVIYSSISRRHYDFETGVDNDVEVDELEAGDYDPSQADDATFSDILYAIEHWLDKAADLHLELPPSVYSRITTRFYYTLTRMDEELTASVQYSGSLLHRQIIAFLSSVLVEERLASNVPRKIAGKMSNIIERKNQETKEDIVLEPLLVGPILDNPTKSDTPFWQNFPFADITAEHNLEGEGAADFSGLPLFELVFSCPIWAFFLMPETPINRGNRAYSWKLLEQQFRSWPGPSSSEPTEEEMARRRRAVQIDDGQSIIFPNLWAPLNSVPVLKAGAMQRAVWDVAEIDPTDRLQSAVSDTTQRTARKGRGKKSVEESASPDDVPLTDISRNDDNLPLIEDEES